MQDYVHFHISDSSTPWHELFDAMEEMKASFDSVEDYSVSETTLEQVFLSFAKEQRTPDAAPSSQDEEQKSEDDLRVIS